MAYFNPTPVTFNPSPIIMEGANAIGRTMQDLYRQNYQEAQDRIKQSQADRMFGLQQNQFDFQKERAGVEDDKWGKTFQAGRDDSQTRADEWQKNYAQRNAFHNDTVNFQNKQLANSGESLNLQKQQVSNRQEQERAKGLYIADLYPELASKFGAVVKNTDGTVLYDDKKLLGLGGLDDITKAKMTIDARENDPYKKFMEYLELEKLKEEKSVNDEKEKQYKVKQLNEQLINNPKSLLGIAPEKLDEKDYQLMISDINNGNLGKLGSKTVEGFFGNSTKPKYIPFGNDASAPQKQIVERRQTKDGRVLVKYSDGTIGEQ